MVYPLVRKKEKHKRTTKKKKKKIASRAQSADVVAHIGRTTRRQREPADSARRSGPGREECGGESCGLALVGVGGRLRARGGGHAGSSRRPTACVADASPGSNGEEGGGREAGSRAAGTPTPEQAKAEARRSREEDRHGGGGGAPAKLAVGALLVFRAAGYLQRAFPAGAHEATGAVPQGLCCAGRATQDAEAAPTGLLHQRPPRGAGRLVGRAQGDHQTGGTRVEGRLLGRVGIVRGDLARTSAASHAPAGLGGRGGRRTREMTT